jgi:hypothetical protein
VFSSLLRCAAIKLRTAETINNRQIPARSDGLRREEREINQQLVFMGTHFLYYIHARRMPKRGLEAGCGIVVALCDSGGKASHINTADNLTQRILRSHGMLRAATVPHTEGVWRQSLASGRGAVAF